MSREASKKAAKELVALCETEGVKMPTNPINALVEAGTMLNATRENGEYQMQKALAELVTKFGRKAGYVSASAKRKADAKKQSAAAAAVKKEEPADDVIAIDGGSDAADTKSGVKSETTKTPPKKRTPVKRRAVELSDDDDDNDGEPKQKKARAKPMATNSANQKLADAFQELSGFEFKRGERFKGGTWAKVAKALRDSEDAITDGKEAMKLKGIGKGTALKIDELLETGTLTTLEEYRAGNM